MSSSITVFGWMEYPYFFVWLERQGLEGLELLSKYIFNYH
jgi:hypothetical protein